MIATGLRIQLLVGMATIISIFSCLRGAVPIAPAYGAGADVMGPGLCLRLQRGCSVRV